LGTNKKVQEIIDSVGVKLYFQFNIGWNGRFGDYSDPAKAMKIEMLEEFMRRVKKANVWITWWLYDNPCNGSSNIAPCDDSVATADFRLFNINWAVDSLYSKVLNTAKQFSYLYFGFSLQTGKYWYYYNGTLHHHIREINAQEFLYNTNLALLYGSKLISPWLYFGGWDNPDQKFTGILNFPNFFATD
jgi:hypothetical protein